MRRVQFARRGVQGMSSRQNRVIFAGRALSRADVANTAVPMIDVVPPHETDRPSASVVDVGKPFDRKLRPILRACLRSPKQEDKEGKVNE